MRIIQALACSAMAGASLFAGGYGLGFQTVLDQGNGMAIVPRLDYFHTSDAVTLTSTGAPVQASVKTSIPSLGVDYDWFFLSSETGKGLYAIAGLALTSISMEMTGTTAIYSARDTTRKNTLIPQLGLGYQFSRHFSMELLWRDVQDNDVTLPIGQSYAAYSMGGLVQVGLNLRF